MSSKITIVGRSSSHFSRTLRMVAHELDVPHTLAPVFDLGSVQTREYADNPALKIPILVTDEGPWFGALAAARELARRAREPKRIVWPEETRDRIASNAQELVLTAMSTEVQLIMAAASSAGELPKARASLIGSIEWLDQHLAGALARSERADAISFLAITAFCLISHLSFRKVLAVEPYGNLLEFCSAFSARASAQATPYCFDAPPG